MFADMKKPDVFETRPKPEEESNTAFTAFSDMMDLDLFKSTENKPDSLMALVAKEVGVVWYKSQLKGSFVQEERVKLYCHLLLVSI